MQNTIEKVLPAAAKNRKAAQSEITRAKIVDMAEKMVRAAVNAGDQQRMVDSFVGDVATATPAGRAGGGPA